MKDVLSDQQKASAWDLTRFPAFEGTAIIDATGTIVYAYPPFCEILKLSPAEVVGMAFADLFPYPHKAIIQRNVRRVMDGLDHTYTDEAMMVLPDGRSLPVVVMFNASFKENGAVDFVIKRIMEAQRPAIPSPSSSESRKVTPWEWLKENYKILATIAAGAVLIIAEVIKRQEGQ